MDFAPILFYFLLCILSIYVFLRHHRRPATRPPGPPPFPIIGNILQLGRNPHQSLTQLSKTYGPIMCLELGHTTTVIISSRELAKRALQTHDRELCGRPHPATIDVHGHPAASVAWLPAGDRWRVLRKICKDHMFSAPRLDASWALRREKMEQLSVLVGESCRGDRVVDIGEVAFTTSLNLISTSMFSMEFSEFGSCSSRDFKGIVRGLLRVAAAPNLADYFPVLKPFDPQGIRRKSAAVFGRLLKIFDDIIDERLKSRVDHESKNDLLEDLLDISRKNESEFSRNDIKHLLLDLFGAGIDTTATTVEWAMSELIRSPNMITKARNELRTLTTANGPQIEESDISKLPYLQAVLKETFRLHPTGPLLVPHKAEADTEINGFIVPKNAQILVNAWAIGRDSSVWSNPETFEPERFLDSKIDFRGQDFELIPFGSGRRICPGLPLAYRMVHLMVACLIRDFDWKIEGGEIDMNEKFEFSLQRVVPLRAVPVRV